MKHICNFASPTFVPSVSPSPQDSPIIGLKDTFNDLVKFDYNHMDSAWIHWWRSPCIHTSSHSGLLLKFVWLFNFDPILLLSQFQRRYSSTRLHLNCPNSYGHETSPGVTRIHWNERFPWLNWITNQSNSKWEIICRNVWNSVWWRSSNCSLIKKSSRGSVHL